MNNRNNDTRLKSKTIIDNIFKSDQSIFQYPIKLCYLRETNKEGEKEFKIGFSVSKRIYKRAVDRNRIKRLMRESIKSSAFFKNAHEHEESYYLMFIYVGKSILEYKKIKASGQKILKKLGIDK